jgi:hypothetical protein
VILITASGDFVPAIKQLNQREITKVNVAAFLSTTVSAPLLKVVLVIDLCQFTSSYSDLVKLY